MSKYASKISTNSGSVVDPTGEIDFTHDTTLNQLYKNSDSTAKYIATLKPTAWRCNYRKNNDIIYVKEKHGAVHLVAIMVSLEPGSDYSIDYEWSVVGLAITGDVTDCRVTIDIEDQLNEHSYYGKSPEVGNHRPSNYSHYGYYFDTNLYYNLTDFYENERFGYCNIPNHPYWVNDPFQYEAAFEGCCFVRSGNGPRSDGSGPNFNRFAFSRWTTIDGKEPPAGSPGTYSALRQGQHHYFTGRYTGYPCLIMTFKIYRRNANGSETLLDTRRLSVGINYQYPKNYLETKDLMHYIVYNRTEVKKQFKGGRFSDAPGYSFNSSFTQTFWLLCDDYAY